MKKILLVAFQGQPMCFIHVLLNGLELKSAGHECKIIIEGEATTLIPEMIKQEHFLHGLFNQAKDAGLIEGVCKACSMKMNVFEQIEKTDLPFLGDMSGHPGMVKYIEDGFEILNF
ncbi:MAG: cytoplasmic protein [Desulfocapsa sp.]|nr:cytoplasmic protein [Desulfocapsa sp.]